MQRWQSTRNLHCVIDHLPHRLFVSSLKPLASSSPDLSPNNQRYTILRYHQNYHYHHITHSQVLLRSKPRYTSPRRNPIHAFPPPPLTTATARTMSSDDAYMSFLDKANADLNSGRAPSTQQSSSAARTETVDVNVRVPGPLTSVDAYYVSETDEPFEPVALKWVGASKGAWPDPSHLSNLISPSADLSSYIETMSPSSFDPKNHYPSAFRAVRAAAVQASGGGEPGLDQSAVDVKVYRVEVGKSRVEYYLLALDVEGGLIVGLRAKAIES